MSDGEDQSLVRHLYGGDPGPIENLAGRTSVSFAARITKLDLSGKRIEFDRPLRTDVRNEWEPRLYVDGSSVEEVGIEDLGFEFPELPYWGHFTELGFNAIAMSGVRNCWVRNLWIHNADSGIFVSGTHITLRDIRAQQPQSWPQGWGPDLMNIVGVRSRDVATTNPQGRWFEPIDVDRLEPSNYTKPNSPAALNNDRSGV
jgi:hypothetical protein